MSGHTEKKVGWTPGMLMKRDLAARLPEPPTECPCCLQPATEPAKDEKGEWTWNCKEGCNP